MEYLLHISVMIGIFATLAISLDLLVGHTGILPLTHAAFYGLGAYTSALLTVRFENHFFLGVLTGMVTAIVASLLVSLPSLRLHDDYFIIATFGFQMIAFSIFKNWARVTNGSLGISGIPQPVIFGAIIRSHVGFLLVVSVVASFAYLVVHLISSSPFGRVLHAIREDEVFTRSLGKNTLTFKVTAFAVSAALAALAGSLYAHYITYIDPTSFTILESILVISMVIIGGAGSRWGPLIGATILVLLPEALRFLGLPTFLAANLRQIIYGALLVVMMMVRPQGLVGEYGFGRRKSV
jgi:branched-chain amino acid transport system permease protein